MVTLNTLKEWKIKNPQIKNVVLFVSDSLRYDYTPKKIASQGITFKTITAGIETASSFPSMITGLHPPHHGVSSFYGEALPKGISSLLNQNKYNTSLWTENTWIKSEPGKSPLHKTLGCRNRISLSDIKPPFIYIEDEKGGHCPYGWSFSDEEYKEWECLRFFRDYGKKDKKELVKKYQDGIDRSEREFEKRMNILKERDLDNETLVIFTSDHGEHLGEYGGLVGHGLLTSPETVYVPTILIHPELQIEKNSINGGILRHIDLYPTIMSLLSSEPVTYVDGVDIFNNSIPQYGATFSIKEKKGILNIYNYKFREVGLWDRNGGYVFREGLNYLLRLFRAIYFTLLCKRSGNVNYLRYKYIKHPKELKNYGEIMKILTKSQLKFGSPLIDRQESKLLIDKIYDNKKHMHLKKDVLNRISVLKDKRVI